MKQNIYDNEKFSKEYDELRFKDKGINANDLIEIPNLRKLLPDLKGKEILDLGCGYGECDKYYIEQGAKYVLAIDISTHMIQIANKENNVNGIEFKVMPMEEISCISKKFDLIVSSLAIHYIEDFDRLIYDISNLLNEDGLLVFSQAHPIRTCFIASESVPKSHRVIDGKYYGIYSDYNREGARSRKWMGEDVIRYHRNFSNIINTLIKYNFKIEKILEPKPTDEIIEKNHKFVDQWDRPYFLFIKARKN